MKKIILLMLLIFLFSACNQINKNQIEEKECNTNSDCSVAGCSSQICTTKEEAKNTITTCEFKQEYECLKLTECKCISNECKWGLNQEYQDCLNKIK